MKGERKALIKCFLEWRGEKLYKLQYRPEEITRLQEVTKRDKHPDPSSNEKEGEPALVPQPPTQAQIGQPNNTPQFSSWAHWGGVSRSAGGNKTSPA